MTACFAYMESSDDSSHIFVFCIFYSSLLGLKNWSLLYCSPGSTWCQPVNETLDAVGFTRVYGPDSSRCLTYEPCRVAAAP